MVFVDELLHEISSYSFVSHYFSRYQGCFFVPVLLFRLRKVNSFWCLCFVPSRKISKCGILFSLLFLDKGNKMHDEVALMRGKTLTPRPAVLCDIPAPSDCDVCLLALLRAVHSGTDHQKEWVLLSPSHERSIVCFDDVEQSTECCLLLPGLFLSYPADALLCDVGLLFLLAVLGLFHYLFGEGSHSHCTDLR